MFRFATLFALIWWAWTGYTVFATRFDADDGVQRALTLVQTFVVAVMARRERFRREAIPTLASPLLALALGLLVTRVTMAPLVIIVTLMALWLGQAVTQCAAMTDLQSA